MCTKKVLIFESEKNLEKYLQSLAKNLQNLRMKRKQVLNNSVNEELEMVTKLKKLGSKKIPFKKDFQ